MPRKGLRKGDREPVNASCFNEAGAVMPRKAGSQSHFSAVWRCFNEAGAVMPRKASPMNSSLMKSLALQ